jgi:hypothetical protein
MKKLIALAMVISVSAWAVETKYAPNDGTARPGNPGTGVEKSNPKVTRMIDPTVLDSTDPTIEGQETLERSNTTPTPIPDDTTLQGRANKQAQEEVKKEVRKDVKKEGTNPSTSPGVNHKKP